MSGPRNRPHVRDPKDGHCPGCDDRLKVGDRVPHVPPKLSIRPTFTGPGAPSFKPARKGKR